MPTTGTVGQEWWVCSVKKILKWVYYKLQVMPAVVL